MRRYSIFFLLFAVVAGLLAAPALAQTTGSVKGVCKDTDGKPFVQAEVEWVSPETGHKYTLKTDKRGEYFSLGIVPGKYNVKLSLDGKEIYHFTNVQVTAGETIQDFDLKKESQITAQQMSPEERKKREEQAAKIEKEKATVSSLNEKLNAAKASSDAGDYEAAIATLNEANQIDATRDLVWFKLADAYRMSAPKQSDPEEKKKRYEMASADYQKAIDLRTASETQQKEPDNNQKLAAYYNNLAEVDAKANKIDDSVANYDKAAQLDSAHATMYLFNEGAVLTNTGQVDKAIVAFDKVIAADPTKAMAYYWKGVNLIGKATLKDNKMIAPEGTAEAFQKYLELEPNGQFAQPAKDMLASIGAPVETGFGKKKAVKK